MKTIISGAVILGSALALNAATHYVWRGNPDAPVYPYTNGWTSAATNLLEAVNAANTAVPGNTVLVTNGEYVLTNRITVTKLMTIVSVNGPTGTIVNGNAAVCCFYINATNNVVIEGFTITNGYAADSNLLGKGGALYINEGGTVRNCLIVGNTATNQGGGIYGLGYTGSNVLISSCTIMGNVSSNIGGGLRAERSLMLVSNCVIAGNTAKEGGGVYLQYYPTLVNCTISNNYASTLGGGVSMRYGGYTRNSLICGNSAETSGGGVYVYYSASSMANCVISNNVARGGGSSGGGGAYIAYGMTMTNCVIIGNMCTNKGGGLYLYGGNGSWTVQNCLVMNNYGPTVTNGGGGVFVENFTNLACSISACTIVSNRSASLYGGGIYFHDRTITGVVANCIIYSNVAGTANYYDIAPNAASNVFRYCYAGDYTKLPPNSGSSTNYPQFANPGAGNYRLTVTSPCVNTGSNEAWMINALDLDGHRRLDRFRGQVDIGAYEYVARGNLLIVR